MTITCLLYSEEIYDSLKNHGTHSWDYAMKPRSHVIKLLGQPEREFTMVELQDWLNSEPDGSEYLHILVTESV